MSDIHLFAAQVRAARAFLGLKQSELAIKSGVSLPQLNRLERAEAEPRYSTAQKILQALEAEGVSFRRTEAGELQMLMNGDLVQRISRGPVVDR